MRSAGRFELVLALLDGSLGHELVTHVPGRARNPRVAGKELPAVAALTGKVPSGLAAGVHVLPHLRTHLWRSFNEKLSSQPLQADLRHILWSNLVM